MTRKAYFLLLLTILPLSVITAAQSVYPKGKRRRNLSLPSKIGRVQVFKKQFELKKVVVQGFERNDEKDEDKIGQSLSLDVSSAVKLAPVDRKLLKNWVQYVLKHNRDWGLSRGQVLSAGKVVLIKAARLDRVFIDKKLGVLELRMLAMSEEKPLKFYGRPEHIVWVGVLELKPSGQVEKTLTQYKGRANIDHDGINDYKIVGLGKRKQNEVLHLLIDYQGYYAHTRILLNLKSFSEVRYSL